MSNVNPIVRLKKAGMSRADIARELSVTRHAVRWWELGRSTPQGENLSGLVRLAESRGITLLAADIVAMGG